MLKKVAVVWFVFFFFSGCEKNQSANAPPKPGSAGSDTESSSSGVAKLGPPQEYFPMEVGCRWRYTIRLGSVEPIRFARQSWPLGNSSAIYETRGRFSPAMKAMGEATPPKPFVLELRIKAKAEKQGRLQYPEGVELEIVEDELGVFDIGPTGTKSVFWARRPDGHVMEVRVLDGLRSPARSGMFGTGEDGDEWHLIYFPDLERMIEVNGSEEPDAMRDVLISVNPSADGRRVNFVRVVAPRPVVAERAKRIFEGQDESNVPVSKKTTAPGSEEAEAFGKDFVERLSYERGKGLVELVQEVEGRTSMTWKLEEFKKE